MLVWHHFFTLIFSIRQNHASSASQLKILALFNPAVDSTIANHNFAVESIGCERATGTGVISTGSTAFSRASATKRIANGAQVRVDGNRGRVTVFEGDA